MIVWQTRDDSVASFRVDACLKQDGRRQRLVAYGSDSPYTNDSYGHFSVNGDYVAFFHQALDHYGYGAVEVQTAHLRGKPRFRSLPVGRLGRYIPTLTITDVAVSHQGKPAYIVLRENPDYPLDGQFDYSLPLREVHDATGKLLDSGPVSDLKPHRGKLTWLHDGQPRSAPFVSYARLGPECRCEAEGASAA